MKTLTLFFMANICITLSHKPMHFDFSIINYVNSLGYPIETHRNIQTEDGYLIDLHRIPRGKYNFNVADKPVVLLMHGLSTNGDSWVILGENKSLPFLLAERNYDVWIGNARGTIHGRKHVSLDPDKDPSFWDFSWHEIGYYDLPAILNRILSVTGKRQISYVGHSQGGTIYYVLASKKPYLSEYFNIAITMAPGTFAGIGNFKIPPMLASPLFSYLDSLRSTMGIYEVGPRLKEIYCDKATRTEQECLNGAKNFATFMKIDANYSDIEVTKRAIGTGFDSSSGRQHLHYLQSTAKADFSEYDFGFVQNMFKYHSVLPPQYNLNNCRAPNAVLYGQKDNLSRLQNNLRLIKELPNMIFSRMYDLDHVGFVINSAKVEGVYKDVISLINYYAR